MNVIENGKIVANSVTHVSDDAQLPVRVVTLRLLPATILPRHPTLKSRAPSVASI